MDLYKRIFRQSCDSLFELAFRLFFLNKISYGGIVTGELPIGGKDQKSKWKVGVYWNPKTIRKKVRFAFDVLRGRIISVESLDFRDFLEGSDFDFVYADPPYDQFDASLFSRRDRKESKEIAKIELECAFGDFSRKAFSDRLQKAFGILCIIFVGRLVLVKSLLSSLNTVIRVRQDGVFIVLGCWK